MEWFELIADARHCQIFDALKQLEPANLLEETLPAAFAGLTEDSLQVSTERLYVLKGANCMALMPPAHPDEAVINAIVLKVKQRTQREKNHLD